MRMMSKYHPQAKGFSLIELLITLAVLSILVVAAVPLTRNNLRRERELELRRNLRDIRQAIDRYKYGCDGQYLVGPLDKKPNDECYPPNLETDRKSVV